MPASLQAHAVDVQSAGEVAQHTRYRRHLVWGHARSQQGAGARLGHVADGRDAVQAAAVVRHLRLCQLRQLRAHPPALTASTSQRPGTSARHHTLWSTRFRRPRCPGVRGVRDATLPGGAQAHGHGAQELAPAPEQLTRNVQQLVHAAAGTVWRLCTQRARRAPPYLTNSWRAAASGSSIRAPCCRISASTCAAAGAEPDRQAQAGRSCRIRTESVRAS
jgi:hypothetical protein